MMVGLAVTAVAARAEGDAAKGEKGEKKHRVVFEVTVAGPEAWAGVLNNVENLRKAFGDEPTQVEVVAHGQGLGMLLPADNAAEQERMKKLADAGVVFAACRNTMKRKNVTEKDLMPIAITVDSGVAEVVRKQEAGWSYLKSGS